MSATLTHHTIFHKESGKVEKINHEIQLLYISTQCTHCKMDKIGLCNLKHVHTSWNL